jgi:hypothetical protein
MRAENGTRDPIGSCKTRSPVLSEWPRLILLVLGLALRGFASSASRSLLTQHLLFFLQTPYAPDSVVTMAKSCSAFPQLISMHHSKSEADQLLDEQ